MFTLPLLALSTPVQPAPPQPAPVQPATCPPPPATLPPPTSLQADSASLPKQLDGQVSFYAAHFDSDGAVKSEIILGDPDAARPIASLFKVPVLWGLLRGVENGKINLQEKLTTSEATRSIEHYPAGTNSLQTLAERMIRLSDNTAADLLLRRSGPAALSRVIWQASPCTSVLLTTKAMWGAQSGLLPGWQDPVKAGQNYAALGREARLSLADKMNAQALKLSGPLIERQLDHYFHSPAYTPQLDRDLQPQSTARAFTRLLELIAGGNAHSRAQGGLSSRLGTFDQLMSTGCCRVRSDFTPQLGAAARGSKAGSGWRILTLTGYARLKGGEMIAYTFLSEENSADDAEVLETALRPLAQWTETQLLRLP